MTTHFEAGDLVATTRDLQNCNHPDRPLPADTLGIVIAVGPSFVQLDVFGRRIHVRPEALTIVEKEFLTLPTHTGGPRDLWALAARREHDMREDKRRAVMMLLRDADDAARAAAHAAARAAAHAAAWVADARAAARAAQVEQLIALLAPVEA